MSKLVKKAAAHAARKQQMQHTYKPNRLDEKSINRLIGMAILITLISVFSLFAVMMG